jgi:hypothetical protein
MERQIKGYMTDEQIEKANYFLSGVFDDTINCWIATRVNGASSSMACNGNIRWQKTIHKLQKENEVLKDRIKELEGRVIIDNSKVNTNLLKENEALKQQVKEECTCNGSLSYCAMHPKH